MGRLPSPRSRGHRPWTLARVAQRAGALALLAFLAACAGSSDRFDPSAAIQAPPPATGTPVSSSAFPTRSGALAAVDIPPPPRLMDMASAADDRPRTGSVTIVQADTLADVESQLDKALINASACNTDSQCRSVATGGKACGGPTGYQAYSTLAGDPASIEALAARERELSLAAARTSGRVSPCFMVADPGARCVDHRCVIGTAEPPTGVTRDAATH